MAIRINNAKDFAGRTYLTTEALNGFITGFELTGNVLALTVNANGSTAEFTADLGDLVTVTGAEFLAVTSNNITDTKLSTFLNTTSGAATSSKIVTTDASGYLEYANAKVTAIGSSAADTNIPTEKAVKDYVDGKAIVVSAGDGIAIDTTDPLDPKISTDIKIEKLATATSGYAASYQLKIKDASGSNANADANGYITAGSTIDIVKDQFLKDVVLGYGTFVDADTAPTSWTTTKDNTKQAILKLTFNTNTDGDDTAEDTKDVYILVDEMFHDKTAGVGIDPTAMASNVVAVKIADATDALTVYTAKGTTTDLIAATANGIVVADVQAAIDTAVNDEHAKMGAAVSAVESNVATLQSSTSAAVVAINGRVSTLQAETSAAVTALEGDIDALDSKVEVKVSAINGNVSTAVTTAMANIGTAIGTHTANAVQMLEVDKTGLTKNEGIVTVTQNANSIVAVYDTNGVQIYPEISRAAASSGSTGAYDYTLKADYGSATVDTKWTILYTLPLQAYNATAATINDVTYTAGTVTPNGITAGTGATAPAAPAGVTVGDLTYKQNA